MKALELKVPPVLVVFAVLMAMWLVSKTLPRWGRDAAIERLSHWVAIALFISGFAVVASGIVAFRRAGTTVDPTRPQAASSLVNTGIYRFSRNPMYLGFLIVLLGWAVWLMSLPAALLVVAYVAYMNRFQIGPEERSLEVKFGAAFTAYKKRVRRWA